jgi:hypothetical protein
MFLRRPISFATPCALESGAPRKKTFREAAGRTADEKLPFQTGDEGPMKNSFRVRFRTV